MKPFLLTVALIATVALGALAVDHLQTSGEQTSAPHVSLAVDEDGQTVAAWYTASHEPIPLQQLQAMMESAQPPNIDQMTRWMQGGMWVLPRSLAANTTATNKVTRIVTCQCDEDFASIPAGYFGVNPNPCTCTGVKMGDSCDVGVLQATPADGGSAFIRGASLQAIARADNLIEIEVFNQLGDAGALDMPDAGYVSRCESNQ